MGNTIRIGIIDEVPLIRCGLRLVLSELDEKTEFIEARTLKEFLSPPPEKVVDLIIVGLNQQCPDCAMHAIRDIKFVYQDARIIICDDNPTFTTAKYYMGAGGDGYISKGTEQAEMTGYIKQVLNGQRVVSQDVIEAIFSISEALPRPTKQQAPLTDREYRIAVYLSEGKRTSWIAGELDRKNSTISTIKSTIFRKLHIGNVVELREQMGKIATR